jgi:predicted house-cleaning noncanonical NTP pyrophosphatase (MazG superfamily)
MACGIFEVEPNKLLSKLPSMSKFSTMKEQLQEDISNTMKDLNMEQLAKVKKFVSSMPSA